MLLSFNDICLVPSIISDIEHRSECNPYINEDLDLPMPLRLGCLPLFTAPMTSVIDENNWKIFQGNKINTIIPRSVNWETRMDLSDKTFIAVSLSEFERLIDFYHPIQTIHVCIDIANGHMKKLLDLCKQAKEKFGNYISIMAGNIANPDTYLEYAKVGIDYIRCGIGSGSCCTTSSNAGGIHYPMVSLLSELNKLKKFVYENKALSDWGYYKNDVEYLSVPKIVADGGFSNFDQIIKALAIGADYVMLGKIFAMSVEACGEILNKHYFGYDILKDGPFQDWIRKQDISVIKEYDCYRQYYGMSTKKAQSEFGNTEFKTAEGIETLVPIKYTLAGWCDNFISYLRSAMSYANSRNLEEFKKTKYEQISANAFQAYYK